tara:strand:- start:650 stop:871 length:222 start_codon:yes stop_codon:yes gene_type:complete
MSREAAIERALTYFDDGRYMDGAAPRVAVPTGRQDPERPHELILKRVTREGIEIMADVYWDIGNPATPAPEWS